MKRAVFGVCLVSLSVAAALPLQAVAGGITLQQTSARNSVYVIQERSPFHTHESTLTASDGRTTATEIIAIGPDPLPLGVSQTGAINRATIYQRGTAPNLDVQQNGALNHVRSQQHAMP